MSPTNETVVDLNLQCQRQRLKAGELVPDDGAALAGRYVLFIGEQIATRKNDRGLLTDRGQMVRNRAEWTVRAIHPDLSVTVEGASGVVRLLKEYVAEHVDLAYARTGAGAQGRTVDSGILFLEKPTDVRNLYVPMTRGRSTNEVFVATTGEQTALDVVVQSIATDWIDRPALARQAELKQATADSPEKRYVEQSREDYAKNQTRRILDTWIGRPSDPTMEPPVRPPYRPTQKWSELTYDEVKMAEFAGRGPGDYLPEEGGDPNHPTKPWDEMDETERCLAEMYGYEPVGDRWRTVATEGQGPPRRELPGLDLPGF